MAIGKSIGEFSFTSSGVSISTTESGGMSQAVNMEGTATGFGTVIGTMTFYADEPGSNSGRVTWAGSAYLDNGDSVVGEGRGVFDDAGTHKWRVRSIMRVSDGSVLLSEGEVSLEGRTYTGALYAWE